ncbi:hypothetical protein [Malonomonas rubra]|uniref:hypothetical protein n=1 Tax=Malonomonas rubra TaxID=57040 RepID=UPI0009FFC807|nr:hypothetical protein [Malonomonas rubra]
MSQHNENSKPNTGRIGYRSDQIRYLSIFVRSFHQLAVAIFIGAFFFAVDSPAAESAFLFVVVTGILLLFLEALRHRQFYREVFGLITFLKAALVGGAFHKFLPSIPAFLFVFLVASLVSHAPKGIRHRLLF